ncbi:hypothetical protein FSP39_017339 [Pinctada imbricata]|uniref:ZMYM2-like/QRICH1 C-terminal domain-containing protein n=1 Tax=Pinctada imbricata TaxID=66713 RepID=A0AA88Y2Z4_PINIB|nr:hypothetical protein FSP39_017339 [Pinctada imbricata]
MATMRHLPWPTGSIVEIDGSGLGKIMSSDMSTGDFMYEVEIDGTDYRVTLQEHRLTLLPKKTRFQNVDESEIDNSVHNQTNKNTLSKTMYDLKLLRNYLYSIGDQRSIETIPVCELSQILCKFFLGIRKSDGSNYEPSSLRCFMSSFDRHLKRLDYGFSLVTSDEFRKVREVLQAKQRDLKIQGKGNKQNKVSAINDEEIEKLWESCQLGDKTPESIINTLWFYNTVHFGLRGSDEHRSMQWGDVKLNRDSSGLEFLEFTETRQGENPKDIRGVKPKMFSNLENANRCPVEVYKTYAAKRPADYCNAADPFYIATNTVQSSMKANAHWFKRQPIGVNKLSSTMKRMTSIAGIEKKLTNHSARKHLLQKLSENNVPAYQIMQITGHRNIQSINNYSLINETQQKAISKILSTPSSSAGSAESSIYLAQQNNHIQNTAASTTSSISSSCVTIHGGVNTLISGNVYGGSIIVNVMPGTQNGGSPPMKKRRILPKDSNSE